MNHRYSSLLSAFHDGIRIFHDKKKRNSGYTNPNSLEVL